MKDAPQHDASPPKSPVLVQGTYVSTSVLSTVSASLDTIGVAMAPTSRNDATARNFMVITVGGKLCPSS